MLKIIKEAFLQKGHFISNKELVDINNAFRIIQYKNKEYIVKRTSLRNGENEVKNAEKAYSIIGDNCIVNNIRICVVVPKLITDKKCAFLVSEFYGYTMQSKLYLNRIDDINLGQVLSIQKMLYEKGILHRGFLPRNLILKDNIMYFIDWEDTIFFGDSLVENNILCETNFVLNWTYFFPNVDLKYYYKNNSVCKWKEPELIEYELLLSNILDFNVDCISDCRNEIENLVLFAEHPISCQTSVFPNDLAHLISDVYNVWIDVFFDLIAYSLRQKYENVFLNMSYLIDQYIRDNFIDLEKTRRNVLIVLVMMAENIELYNLESVKTIDELLLIAKNQSYWEKYIDVRHVFDLKKALENIILQLVSKCIGKSISGNKKEINNIVNAICNYFFSNNMQQILYINENFMIYRNVAKYYIPGMWSVCLTDTLLNTCAIESICSAIQSIRVLLWENGIRIISLYNENYDLNRFEFSFIPLHISVLTSLNIDLDEYQPYISEYLSAFPYSENYNLFENKLCKLLLKNIEEIISSLKKQNVYDDNEAKNVSFLKFGKISTPIEVDELSELPSLPFDQKFFVCIGGNKKYICFQDDKKLSRSNFFAKYKHYLPNCLRTIECNNVQMRQDATYPVAGFMIVSPCKDYQNLSCMSYSSFCDCIKIAIKIKETLEKEELVEYVNIYYDEHYKKPATAHFWVLPVFKGVKKPRMIDGTIWEYLEMYDYSNQKELIEEYLEKIEKEFR